MDMKPQTLELKKGVEVLVATPGRLLDHIEAKNAVLNQVEYVVLDEADRSEEHTSELQSPCNLVCRLLLEKKKPSTAMSGSFSTLTTRVPRRSSLKICP